MDDGYNDYEDEDDYDEQYDDDAGRLVVDYGISYDEAASVLAFAAGQLEEAADYLEQIPAAINAIALAYSDLAAINPDFKFLRWLEKELPTLETMALLRPQLFFQLSRRFTASTASRAREVVKVLELWLDRLEDADRLLIPSCSMADYMEQSRSLLRLGSQLRDVYCGLGSFSSRALAPFNQTVKAAEAHLLLLPDQVSRLAVNPYLVLCKESRKWAQGVKSKKNAEDRLQLILAIEAELESQRHKFKLGNDRVKMVMICESVVRELPGMTVIRPNAKIVAEPKKKVRPDLELLPISYQGWTVTFQIAGDLLDELELLGATKGSLKAIKWWPSPGKGTWNIIKPRAGGDGYELKVAGQDLGTYRWKRPLPKGDPKSQGPITIRFRRNDFFDEK